MGKAIVDAVRPILTINAVNFYADQMGVGAAVSSQAHLSHLFMRPTGITPTQYRNRGRAAGPGPIRTKEAGF